jgi:hypothetical protein
LEVLEERALPINLDDMDLMVCHVGWFDSAKPVEGQGCLRDFGGPVQNEKWDLRIEPINLYFGPS